MRSARRASRSRSRSAAVAVPQPDSSPRGAGAGAVGEPRAPLPGDVLRQHQPRSAGGATVPAARGGDARPATRSSAGSATSYRTRLRVVQVRDLLRTVLAGPPRRAWSATRAPTCRWRREDDLYAGNYLRIRPWPRSIRRPARRPSRSALADLVARPVADVVGDEAEARRRARKAAGSRRPRTRWPATSRAVPSQPVDERPARRDARVALVEPARSGAVAGDHAQERRPGPRGGGARPAPRAAARASSPRPAGASRSRRRPPSGCRRRSRRARSKAARRISRLPVAAASPAEPCIPSAWSRKLRSRA